MEPTRTDKRLKGTKAVKPANPPESGQHRKSSVTMTKYEHAKIIGVRAEQIARGAQTFVNDDGGKFDPIALATRELHAGVLPFLVVRRLPDASQEHWKINDMNVPF